MPSGIILQSGSVGATQEALEKVFTDNGLEPDKPAVTPAEPVEPKREDFKSDEEFETAQEDFTAKQEEAEQKSEEEEERKRQEQEARHPKLTRRQRAVDKATKKLQDDLRAANERIAALEGKGGKKEEPEAKLPEAPKREAFKTDEEFEDAKFDYRYKLRRAKEQAEESQKTLETQMQKNFTDYQTAVADFKDEHDDWDEVVGKSTSISQPVYFAIVDLGEDGPPVTYHLGQHPEELERLGELTPYRAAIEVGRLADKLKKGEKPRAEEKPKPKPQKIPEPVKPVSTAASSSTLTSREAAEKRDFRAFKVAQRRGV